MRYNDHVSSLDITSNIIPRGKCTEWRLKTMKSGIDVSKHNGVIDWQSVKAFSKVDFYVQGAE